MPYGKYEFVICRVVEEFTMMLIKYIEIKEGEEMAVQNPFTS